MKTSLRWLLLGGVLVATLATAWLFHAALGTGETAAAPAAPPVIFPPDPGWPEYAQREITLNPEPPVLGQPLHVCAAVLNTSPQTQTVTLDFGLANFGIGLPFTPLGSRTVVVPPNSKAQGCVVWIPRQPGHWCLQVILHQPQQPDQRSQRNLDVWEVLTPGVPAETVFPVRNPGPTTDRIQLQLLNLRPGWTAFLTPQELTLEAGESRPVTLTVVPPQGTLLGSREPIVDVEARNGQNALIGGFRKLDTPPVPLHRLADPPYAESEISIEPYPPLPGEPVQLCVELYNLSDEPQPVESFFDIAAFGIGLPFTNVGMRSVVVPAHGRLKVCVSWLPPAPGHYCVQVRLLDPTGRYLEQRSQRNMDVSELLKPGQPDMFTFTVGNPLTIPTTLYLTTTVHLPGWEVLLSDYELPNMGPGELRPVVLTVFPPADLNRLEDGAPVVDVEARTAPVGGELIGGFRKIFRPPISIHRPEDPPYGESEISLEPYPPRAGEPVVICTDLRNPTTVAQTVQVEFGVANFGIGLPFTRIDLQSVTLPPQSQVRTCTRWVPPIGGHFCAQIIIRQPGYRDVFSQRNMDVAEFLEPGKPNTYVFPVGNPYEKPITVTLGLVEHLPGWEAFLTPEVLYNLAPHTSRPVTLTVIPAPNLVELEDGAPVVDVEAYTEEGLLGGFRKLFRPPIPIHRPQDPPYAESEISINPYPPRERQPTEICVDLRNPTDVSQTMTVTFGVAAFGIGLPFHDIVRPLVVTLPPHSIKRVCVTWVPPFGGHFCARVTIGLPGHEPLWSQRNMDVGEILVPGEPSSLRFPVGNPTGQVATVTLGLVSHLPGWQIALFPDVLSALQPGETRPVTLTVTPPRQNALPEPGSPVVDVEGFIHGRLIGGIRKLYYPPIPVHPPQDPLYAESEIFIDPYPTRQNLPTLLGAVVFNPTPVSQWVTLTFGVAHFGIGMPFTTTGIISPVQRLLIPPYGMARARTAWIPQFNGHVCVQIEVRSPGLEPVHSQRNIDVGEPLRPDRPHARVLEVRNPTSEVVTVTMALINHRPNWSVALTPMVLPNMRPGEVRPVTLTVQPPSWEGLADGEPIVDVEAYLPDGTLIGGIRKLAKPPIPLHKPQDRPYAETEISVTPEPIEAGRPTTITTQVINTGEVTQTVLVRFGVANFGMGITFTNTNIVPTYRVVTLTPGMSTTVSAVWTPPSAGHWCIQIILADPQQEYPEQRSQRNVEVHRRQYQPCQPITSTFQLSNSGPLTVTVDIGAHAINLPPGWTYSTDITQTVLGPYQSLTVTLTITPPCQLSASALNATLATNSSGGPPEINVEGYVDGELLGGIQVQLESAPTYPLYLPLVLRNR